MPASASIGPSPVISPSPVRDSDECVFQLIAAEQPTLITTPTPITDPNTPNVAFSDKALSANCGFARPSVQ